MRVSLRKVLPFLAPSLVGLLIFFLGPLVIGLPFSVWSPGRGWLGLGPFLATLQNAMFRLGVRNSALFLLLCVSSTLGLTLAFSLWLNRARRALAAKPALSALCAAHGVRAVCLSAAAGLWRGD